MGSRRGHDDRMPEDVATRDVRPPSRIDAAVGHFRRASGEMKKVNCSIALLDNIDILPVQRSLHLTSLISSRPYPI